MGKGPEYYIDARTIEGSFGSFLGTYAIDLNEIIQDLGPIVEITISRKRQKDGEPDYYIDKSGKQRKKPTHYLKLVPGDPKYLRKKMNQYQGNGNDAQYSNNNQNRNGHQNNQQGYRQNNQQNNRIPETI